MAIAKMVQRLQGGERKRCWEEEENLVNDAGKPCQVDERGNERRQEIPRTGSQTIQLSSA